MTIDDMQTELEDISDRLTKIATTIEGIDTSDLSAEHRHFVSQASKLAHSASGYAEEAAQYLELD